MLFAVHETKPTILADVELQELSEIGNIGRESNKIILTQCQLTEVGETEEFLKRGKQCMKEFAITLYCIYTCICARLLCMHCGHSMYNHSRVEPYSMKCINCLHVVIIHQGILLLYTFTSLKECPRFC